MAISEIIARIAAGAEEARRAQQRRDLLELERVLFTVIMGTFPDARVSDLTIALASLTGRMVAGSVGLEVGKETMARVLGDLLQARSREQPAPPAR